MKFRHPLFFTATAAALFSALPALSACSPLQTPFDTPEKTAREFHRSLLTGDCKKAFDLLDEKTQKLLREKAKAEAKRAGGISEKPEMMICQGDTGLYGKVNLSGDDVVAVRLMEKNADGSVTIGVSIRGQEWPTRLVKQKERDQWLVDLSDMNLNFGVKASGGNEPAASGEEGSGSEDQQVQPAESASAVDQPENGKAANVRNANVENSGEKSEPAKSAVENGSAPEVVKSSGSPSSGETPQGENQQKVSPASKTAD